MPPKEHKLVYQAQNNLQAHCIKGMLAQIGIEAVLNNEVLSGALGELPVDIKTEIYVYHTQFYRASKAIQGFELNSEPDWQCKNCHEINAASFEICWHCSTEHNPTDN
ncbi:DUF2007 domain-containing protein [Catenovulum sediminis]|uniref:DUF2007 domain-containing protein n=1 Tax=Catenovulum sediminis TaxID=1740262 RepID=A0ABV1RDX8_9ALTE